jgi:hypothetical protein
VERVQPGGVVDFIFGPKSAKFNRFRAEGGLYDLEFACQSCEELALAEKAAGFSSHPVG